MTYLMYYLPPCSQKLMINVLMGLLILLPFEVSKCFTNINAFIFMVSLKGEGLLPSFHIGNLRGR